ncbi:MAG: periplasmic heavy metal sensor [Deltaproteobacteria bacterium]|nr:periplasmic heavy metal sensor [Deltaproteobacteria bacterium]
MKDKSLKLILILSLVLNFLFLTALGYHFYRGNGHAHHERGHKSRVLMNTLELTPEQQKMIEEKDIAFRKATGELKEEIVKKRKQLIEHLRADKQDRAAVNAVLTDVSELQGRMQALVVEHLLEEKAILKKEQQSKFFDLFEKRLERKMERTGQASSW